ncbi:F-box/kelch-repeat protein At3g06240-like [Papaver somniferum]|uniref:F-box/kelch-repeat protein At3g06240-like n=1 Tax=Papaver somniferum TaxID=3469 RepID=UPI000E6F8DC5|nr:F-box/kelch-repeat protein At3g06240-like [Papaver somniferum]
MRWTCLKDLLYREGIDTSHRRLLLSMNIIVPDEPSFSKSPDGIVEFQIASPNRGLVSINRLIFDYATYLLPYYVLPRQTVSGLLCFTKRHDAFAIYNPITGERSPWIEAKRTLRRKYSSIGFGFNPQSGEHKVIWISSNKCGSKQVVKIFTVGKNTWRSIDAITPISISQIGDDQYPFHVNGCLYWRFRWRRESEQELLMRFDMVTEKFRVIPIPTFFIEKKILTVELTEIDGRIAVLHWIHEFEISLWTFHEDADGNIKWSEEIICMPLHWDKKLDLSIEALWGTNLIFL